MNGATKGQLSSRYLKVREGWGGGVGGGKGSPSSDSLRAVSGGSFWV